LALEQSRTLPPPPDGLRKLIVISPFLDGTTVGELGQWGDESTERLLLSNRSELSKLAAQRGKPLEGFSNLLAMEAPPTDQETAAVPLKEDATAGDDAEIDQRGLHAKMIYAHHAQGHTAWIGSANATQRGWRGPNAEVIATLHLGKKVVNGIESLIQEVANIVKLEALPPFEEDKLQVRLDDAQRQVAARWNVQLKIRQGVPTLMAETAPHPDDEDVQLAVNLLGQPGLIDWERNRKILRLQPVRAGELTELVRCRLRLGPLEHVWVQRTPMDPPPDEERDRDAIARYLDARTFLQWIRSLLDGGSVDDGGGEWSEDEKKAPSTSVGRGPTWWAPTLEEILRAWTRDPGSLVEVDRRIRHYLKIWHDKGVDLTPEDRSVLEEFRSSWDVLRRELVIDRR
jgi:hypothetical protein